MIQRQHRPNAVTTTRGSSKLKTFVHFMQFLEVLKIKVCHIPKLFLVGTLSQKMRTTITVATFGNLALNVPRSQSSATSFLQPPWPSTLHPNFRRCIRSKSRFTKEEVDVQKLCAISNFLTLYPNLSRFTNQEAEVSKKRFHWSQHAISKFLTLHPK